MSSYGKIIPISTIVTTVNSSRFDLQNSAGFSVTVDFIDTTPSAKVVPSSAIVFAIGIWTSTAHGFPNGLKVQLTTSSALPTGLSLATDYFVISVSANSFKLASSLDLALAGTAVSISGSGTGNQSVTPSALAGGSVKIQATNDNVEGSEVWADLPGEQPINGTFGYMWNVSGAYYKFIRLIVDITSGSISFYASFNAKTK